VHAIYSGIFEKSLVVGADGGAVEYTGCLTALEEKEQGKEMFIKLVSRVPLQATPSSSLQTTVIAAAPNQPTKFLLGLNLTINLTALLGRLGPPATSPH
jgi:hypothetical protein